MRKALGKKETINKIIRMFLAQYLTTVGPTITYSEDFSSFQNDSLNLLTAYIRAFVTRIATNVKAITNMQARTESNILHLIFSLSEFDRDQVENMVKHLTTRRSNNLFNHGFFEKLKDQVFFEDDLDRVNRLQQNTDFSNIRAIRKTFTIDPRSECLPFKVPLHQLYPLPPEYTYRENRRSLEHEERNPESTRMAVSRDTKKAICEVVTKKQRDTSDEQPRFVELKQPYKKVKTLDVLKQF